MKSSLLASVAALAVWPIVLATMTTGASAQTVPLGTTGNFAVLAATTITNTGPTVINGDIGLYPGTDVTGFPPGVLNGVANVTNAVAQQAQTDLTAVYNDLAGRNPPTLIAGTLGGQTLTAGIYQVATTADITGTLTFDAEGNPNAIFIINIPASLDTASASNVLLLNGAQAGNVFFRVGSSATLGTTSTFNGRIVALTSITLTTNAVITCGSVWARNGAVALDTNVITVCPVTVEEVGAVIGDDTTENDATVVDTIDEYIDDGTPLPVRFQELIGLLTIPELADTLKYLAGETATGVAPVAHDGLRDFLSLALTPGADRGGATVERGGPGPSTTPTYVSPTYVAPNNNTVMTMGYANETPVATSPAFVVMDAGAPAVVHQGPRRTVWIAGFGDVTHTAGDPDLGTHDRAARSAGFAIGVDATVSPTATIGISVGTSTSTFTLADDLGGGQDRMLMAAVTGRLDSGAAYITAGIAYSWNRISTHRSVTVLATDEFAAEFSAHNIGAEVEVGYRFGGARVSITPYASAAVQALFMPAYTERTVSGSSDFALSYDAHVSLAIHTELGVRVSTTMTLGPRADLTLSGSLAWGHDFLPGTSVDGAFPSLPGSGFTVNGASPGGNALLVTAGAEVAFHNGLSLGVAFNGSFARGQQSYGVKARIAYSW